MTTQLTFAFEKETKGAVRYQEQGIADGAEGTIGTLYIRKSALRDLNGGRIPSTLTVTVEAQ